jgi:hypothetical protein
LETRSSKPFATTRRIRLPHRHKLPEPLAPLVVPADIVMRDDGMWSIGWGDDSPGPFETKQFAAAVARAEAIAADTTAQE